MIEFEFNGQLRSVGDGTTILSLLTQANIEARFCAVERNLEIVPKSEYASTEVESGDKIEVVTLVGGG